MLNSTAQQQAQPRTVLVVEDEPTLATAIAQRITAEGWSARVAGDGASAVQAAAQLRPHLVIMDIMLPVMDGLEATKRIVADRPVPVLILTARDDEADKAIGLGAGADDYMTRCSPCARTDRPLQGAAAPGGPSKGHRQECGKREGSRLRLADHRSGTAHRQP